MLTIRLSRKGKKKQITYRLIISEKARDPYGRALEILGNYNPTTKTLNAKADRINYWISKGAGLSPTINNLLIKENIIKGKKVKATKIKSKKPKEGENKTEEKKLAPKDEESKKEDDVKKEEVSKTEEKAETNTKESK